MTFHRLNSSKTNSPCGLTPYKFVESDIANIQSSTAALELGKGMLTRLASTAVTRKPLCNHQTPQIPHIPSSFAFVQVEAGGRAVGSGRTLCAPHRQEPLTSPQKLGR